MNTGSCIQTSAAGMKPYKHTTLSYQSGCQWITLSDTHTVFTMTRCGGKNESRASGRGRKRARGRDGSMSGREETNVLKDFKNHSASERVCVLMSMCAPSRPSSTIFAQLPWQPPSLSLCACVWGM